MKFKLTKGAVKPTRMTEGAAGFDLTACSIAFDLDNQCVIYDTGVSVELPEDTFLDLRSRSSIYRAGPYFLANGAGVIDSDYRGTIKFIFKCVDPTWAIQDYPPYEIGDRICQVILQKYYHFENIKQAENLTQTERGERGFGSTNEQQKSQTYKKSVQATRTRQTNDKKGKRGNSKAQSE